MRRQPLASATAAIGAMPVIALLRQNVVWIGMTLIAMLSTPGPHTGGSLVAIIIASVLAAMSLTELRVAGANGPTGSALQRNGTAIASALIAVAISIAVHPLSGLLLAGILGILTVAGRNRPLLTAALTVALVPWWVWLALNEWQWQLLVLVPFVGLALVTVSHLLDTHAWPDGEERVLSARAHRWAAWMTIALSGLLLMLAGLITDTSRPLLALAGSVMALSVPLEAGFGSTRQHSAAPSLRIVVSAYLIAVACWLIGIA